MKASLRLILAVMALGTFGFGCEYYKYGNAQTLPLSQDQIQKMREAENAKSQAGIDDVVLPSAEGSGTTGSGTGGMAGDEVIVPTGDGPAVTIPVAGTGGTTGGTTGGVPPQAPAVDVEKCLSINSSSYFRCFYRDINHSFCADLFGKRISCPDGATPSCRSWNEDNWYCREDGDGGCVDKTTLARAGSCGDRVTTSAGSTTGATTGGTTGGMTGGAPVDPATCEKIETSDGPAGYSRCFSSTRPAPTSSGLCADASGHEIACPDDAWVTCSPSKASSHAHCSEENSDWCVRLSDFHVDDCPAASTMDSTDTPPPPPAPTTTETTSPGTVHVFSINATNDVVSCSGSMTGSWSHPSCTTLNMKSQTPITTLYQPKQPNDALPEGGVIHIFGTNGNWLTYAYCPANDMTKCNTKYPDKSSIPMQESPSAVLAKDATIYLFSVWTGQWDTHYAVAVKGKGQDQGFGKINSDPRDSNPNNLMSSMMTPDEWNHCANPNTGLAAALTKDASGKERIDVFSSNSMVHMSLDDLDHPESGWKCSFQPTNNFMSSRPVAFPENDQTLGDVLLFGPNSGRFPTLWSFKRGGWANTSILSPSLAVFTANDQTVPAISIGQNGELRYFFVTGEQRIRYSLPIGGGHISDLFSNFPVMKNSQPAVATDPSGNITVFAIKENAPGNPPALVRYTRSVDRQGVEHFTQGEIIYSNILNNSWASPAAVFTP